MNWKYLYESVTYPFEVVCPDGLVRRAPYQHETDAEADAKLASEKGCPFDPVPISLELQQGPCPGGPHRVGPRRAA